MADRLELPECSVEPLASLLNTLRLERIGDLRYRGTNLPQISGRVYGGQVFAQATMVAADTVPGGPEERLAHSITAAFLRPGHVDLPLDFEVSELNDGRSFSTRSVRALQEGKILFTARISFQLRQKGVSWGSAMPAAPDPESLPSSVDFFAAIQNPWGHLMSSTNAIDMRHVDGNNYLRPAPDRSPRQLLWLRTRSPMPQGSSRLLQRATLGYAADQFMLDPVLRAHGLYWADPQMSVATLDHSIWWHRNFDMSDWILADVECQSTQNGRGLVIARFYQHGRHIATMSQEGMVKVRKNAVNDD